VLTDAWTGLIAMTIRDGVLVYLLLVIGRELFREVRATFGVESVDLVATAAREPSIALGTSANDVSTDGFDDEVDPRGVPEA
jgi:hypothetical protein